MIDAKNNGQNVGAASAPRSSSPVGRDSVEPSNAPPPFPGAEYRAAINQETENRDYAFLDLPREICGIPVKQITLRQLLTRFAIGCPFFYGRTPSAEDVA